jgi:SpoVK/Ycf46/Vps4 family AAA+-type ATPase
MSKTTEFIKIGDRLVIKPDGADYDLIPGKVYDLSYDRFVGEDIFKENGDLNFPGKLYTSKKDDLFKKRVLTYFNNSFTNTTGVMLAGVKGTGKTVCAKVLAQASNLPIIVVDPVYPEQRLIKFFKQIKSSVCILFDEVDKSFDTDKMLDFLDGIQKTSKKLVIMTCNNLSKVSEYLQDRCSRIRYLRKYTPEDNLEFLDPIITDLGIKNTKEVSEYCRNNIKLLSMDNIVSFLNEVKMLEDEDISLDEIISVMNIETTKPKSIATDKTTSDTIIPDGIMKQLSQNVVAVDISEDDEYNGNFDFNDLDDDEMTILNECCCAA